MAYLHALYKWVAWLNMSSVARRHALMEYNHITDSFCWLMPDTWNTVQLLDCHNSLLSVKFKRLRFSHQPSLRVVGPHIIDSLLLFQCFQENDHHGNTQLCSSLSGFRRRLRAAILDEGGGQMEHLGERGDGLVTSHLQSSPEVLMEVGGCLSHVGRSLCWRKERT